ncbi:MAG TPA: efflux RND transporter periplasmic adaptor subunit [Polyangiaceae bacterium]|jgi:cobalt-zinc-cadmium efflux system membrane fusion protein|nr:efflux RND transporter periplasmic adaptor subunit [Polyangiaceae bacterium]
MKTGRRLWTGIALAARFALVASAATTISCHRSEAAPEPPGPQPPAGQVWLTAQQAKDAKIEVQTIAEQDVDDTILTSGRVSLEDLRSAHIFTPVTGRIVKISAGLGMHVKKGDPLAVIESPDIGNAVSDVHKAEADLIAAEHDFKRKKELFEQKAGSAADQEASEDNWRKATAEVERARQKAYLLRAGNVDNVTQTYTLPSPIDGEVLAMNINPGMEVQGQYTGGATQELFTIGEIDKVWVLGDLYEMDLARVQIGSPAAVTTVAYKDKVFNGHVDWVSGMLDPNTRTTKVRATFDNPDRLLRPEMFVTVQISVEQKKALAIPRNALLRLGEYKVVFVQVGEDGGVLKFERLPVDVDEGESSQWLEVRHGLEIGQKVVVSGAILLSQKL